MDWDGVKVAEIEATDVKLELEEPKGQNFSIDDYLSMDMDSDVKFYGMNDFHSLAERGPRSSKAGYVLGGHKQDNFPGGLHSFTAQHEEDELNLGALDGILDEIDEVEGDVAAQSLATACKDYLSDLDFTQEISSWGHYPRNKIQIGNSSSDSHYSECSGSSNGAVAASETLVGTDLEHNGRGETCGETISCGMYRDCRKQNVCAQHGEINNSLLLSNIGKPNDLWNMTNTSMNEPSYGKNNSAKARVDDVDLGQRRQRKPTKRYIEESKETKPSRHVHAVEKLVPAALEGYRQRGRPPGRTGNVALDNIGIRHVDINLWEEGDLNSSSLNCSRKEWSHKPEICMEDEAEETSSDESENEIVKKKFKKSGDRRKHQRMWTLPEVTMLIDGVSEFGVGRWTQIKRLSFSASAHRTPIDLRDKWRNLLRASYAQKSDKGVIQEEEKNSGRLLPKSLLHRVHELASIHPYPRRDMARSPSLSVGKKRY